MKLQANKKKVIRWSIEFIILIGMIIFFIIINKKIDIENGKKETEGYKYYLDMLEYDETKGEIYIQGWCLKEGVSCSDEISRKNFKVFLAKDGKREEMIEIPVEACQRTDVNKKYGKGEIDYTYCGFKGSAKVDSSIKDSNYRVLFLYDSSVEKYFYTTKYLNKGEYKSEMSQWDYNYK